MAEAVFVHTVKTNNLEDRFGKIDSAGTASYHVSTTFNKLESVFMFIRLVTHQIVAVQLRVKDMVYQ
jgi:hypothetical protein